MSTTTTSVVAQKARHIGPVRAAVRFVLAALYFLLARFLADRGAHGLVSKDWAPLVE